jgi:hypothetical protein
MENIKAYKTNVKKTATILLAISFLLISGISCSQKPADFSGEWILNTSKSSPSFTKNQSTIVITQDDNKITMAITLITNNSSPITKTEEYLIGAGISGRGKSSNKITTITSAWLPDKQSFTTTNEVSIVENGTTKVSKQVKVYSITDGGKTLTIKSDDTLPEGSTTPESERHSIQIFNKSR